MGSALIQEPTSKFVPNQSYGRKFVLRLPALEIAIFRETER